MRSRTLLAALALALTLSGCASISGRPAPITADDVKGATNPVCPSIDQLTEFENKPVGRQRGDYRDRIIMICANAYTNRFNSFTGELSEGSTLTNLIGDTTAGTLSTVAGVASPKAAKRLSVIAAAILGIQGAVNNDVYSNKAVSALIAAMQTKRLEVMTGIVRAQTADPNGETYTLAKAGIDLRNYEEAGTLATGIAELNKAASTAQAKAADNLAKAQISLDVDVGGPLSDDADTRLTTMTDLIKAIPDTKAGRAKLDAIAKVLQVPVSNADAADVKFGKIYVKLRGEFSNVAADQQSAKMDEFETKLNPLLK